MHEIFILVHSNLIYIQFVKATWARLCTISKDLQSLHSYTFKISKKHTQKTLESHKNHNNTTRHLLQTWKTTRHTHKAWQRSNLCGSKALPTLNTFSKLQTQAKASRIDLTSIFTSCKLNDHERERISRFPEWFHTQKWSCYLSFKNHNTYSQTVTKFNMLIFTSIGWFHLT